jgi:hypothetical protein
VQEEQRTHPARPTGKIILVMLMMIVSCSIYKQGEAPPSNGDERLMLNEKITF